MPIVHRRSFLQQSSVALAGLTASTARGAAERPNERIVMAIMGLRGRGQGLVRGFLANDDVDIAYLCDVDEAVVPAMVKAVEEKRKKTPKVEKDIRRILEDRTITAIGIAAPDHWHALATIWGCQADKHVYVEKPASHNVVEGRRMIDAARRYNRVVQVGTQRRSSPSVDEAADFVRSGKLGKVPCVRTWIAGNRKTIGHKPDGPVPAGVDYDLWLGPAPTRPFNPNRFHYEWHWNWDYGTGELGNNGIHALDVVRKVLDLDAPVRISSGGGIHYYDDDRQTPDTQIATFDFPNTCVTWEHRIWSKTGSEGESWGIVFYGQNGSLLIDSKGGWRVMDGVTASGPPSDYERPHLRNFLDCVKSGKRPNADIEEGHKSTRLCHLGNIAYRVGRTLRFDAASEQLTDDAEANALLSRSYRKGFAVPERV